MFYMPVWSVDELVSISRIMKINLTEEEVKVKYEEFGGILRHIFSKKASANVQTRKERNTEISKLNKDSLLLLVSESSIEDPLSHLIAQFTIQKKTNDLLLNEKIEVLVKGDETGYSGDYCNKISEDIILDLLMKGVVWKKRIVNDTTKNYKEFKFKFKKIERGKMNLKNIKFGVLYKSMDTDFPFVDIVFRENTNTIAGIQITRERDGQRKITSSAYNQLIKLYNGNTKMKFSYYYCPIPSLADIANVSSDFIITDFNMSVSILKVPPNYKSNFD
jgi:hypothetical protein